MPRRTSNLMLALGLWAAIWPGAACHAAPAATSAGELEFDGDSAYSHVRVRRQGTVRSLTIVRDSGEEALQSQIDLRKPQVLRFPYLRHLFAAYLLQPQPKNALIVGLGGGGMVKFLDVVDPELNVVAVEIDPLVVDLADRFFDVRSGPRLEIVVSDGVEYLRTPGKAFDAIYMDAFLKPSADTDDTGAPLALRNRAFYRQIGQRLRPGGVAAFNLNPHRGVADDLADLAAAFGQTYVLRLPQGQGYVVVATREGKRRSASELRRAARSFDKGRRFRGLLSMEQIVEHLVEAPQPVGASP